jgi:hypothetical protein
MIIATKLGGETNESEEEEKWRNQNKYIPLTSSLPYQSLARPIVV